MTPIFSPISYGSVVKNPLAVQKMLGTQVQSLGQKDPMEWEPTPVFLPGKFHGQRSPASYSPHSRKESDMIEHACYAATYEGSEGRERWRCLPSITHQESGGTRIWPEPTALLLLLDNHAIHHQGLPCVQNCAYLLIWLKRVGGGWQTH